MSPDRSAGRDQPAGRPARGRGQSEVIGVTILTGVVVVVALTVGALVIAQTTADDAGPTTDLVLDVSGTDVTLSHNGGDPLVASEVTVILRGGGAEHRFTPDASDVTGGDAQLDPGESIQRSHGFPPGDVEVLVVHDPSGGVVFEDRASIPS